MSANGRRQAGISLVELIMFIVIVSVGIAGILLVMNITTRHSADPMVRKQALAIAEALLEEIMLQPFTWCDPDDANAATAATAAGCAATPESIGPEGESRYAVPRFDNVNDYHQFSMSPIATISNSPVAGLGAYSASVAVAEAGNAFGLTGAEALKIDVRVQSGDTDITLTGYRFRYAPNAVP